MKKLLTFVATLCLLLFPLTAGAQGVLEYDALESCAQELIDALSGYALRNEPAETYDPSGDGAYLYDYGALQLTMTGTEVLLANVRQIEITDASVAGPCGVRVGDSMETLFAALNSRNPRLTGDESFATLYVDEVYSTLDIPEYDWAWVLRSGETAYGVQAACSLPQADGTYIDAGALFILTEGRVSAIRLYGFGEVITAQEAAMNFDTAREIQMRNSFTPEDTLLSGVNVRPVVVQENLTVDGKALLNLPESVLVAAIGEAQSVRDAEDETGAVRRVLLFEGMEATLDASGVTEEIVITGEEIIGPCGLRVGMDVREALALLRVDESVHAGKNAVLYLEGEAGDDPPYAYMDFFADGRAAIRIGVRLEGETTRFAMIYADFAGGVLEEIRMYTYTM